MFTVRTKKINVLILMNLMFCKYSISSGKHSGMLQDKTRPIGSGSFFPVSDLVPPLDSVSDKNRIRIRPKTGFGQNRTDHIDCFACQNCF